MLGKIVLWLSAAVFIGYGVVCFFAPSVPASYAGMALNSGDAVAEIGAMYGGLQTGFGVFCLLAAINPAFYRAGLVLLVICIGLLALGRLYSTVVGAEPVGVYTWGAMAFEITIAALAAVALRQR